jgi:hypothetical protein
VVTEHALLREADADALRARSGVGAENGLDLESLGEGKLQNTGPKGVVGCFCL